MPARDAPPQERQENDGERLHRDRQRECEAADQRLAARERQGSEGEQERAGHVEVPVAGDLERDERAPEVREHPARISSGGHERSPDDERQECVAHQGGQLDGARRFTERRRGEEEELRAGRVGARHIGVVHRPVLAGSQVRERRVGRNHRIGAAARAQEVGVPEVAANVGRWFRRREQHRDTPGQGHHGAGDQRATGRPEPVRDLVQRREVPHRGEGEQDKELGRSVVRSNQAERQERQAEEGAAGPSSNAGAHCLGRVRRPGLAATTRGARRCGALAPVRCAARRRADEGPPARRRRTTAR